VLSLFARVLLPSGVIKNNNNNNNMRRVRGRSLTSSAGSTRNATFTRHIMLSINRPNLDADQKHQKLSVKIKV